jgi:hypothetical protein
MTEIKISDLEEGMQMRAINNKLKPCFRKGDVVTVYKLDGVIMSGFIIPCRGGNWHPIEDVVESFERVLN